MPADAGAVQRLECERAFFAGAVIVLNLVTFGASDDEESAMTQLQLLHDECESKGHSLGIGTS